MKGRPHSFTLLETLLVVTLLGLLAGYALRGVFGSSDSPKQILKRIASIDAEARLMARGRGSATLVSDPESASIALTADALDRRYEIGSRVRLLVDQEYVARIQFDRHGQSPSYTVTIESAQQPAMHVAGQTGWMWFDGE